MAAVDIAANAGSSPITGSAAVTPSDTTDLAYTTRALYVGGTGNITLVDASGNTTLFSALPAGTWLWIRATRIKATGTTATLIVALW